MAASIGAFAMATTAPSTKWDGLLSNSPFGEALAEKKTEPVQQLELRGVVVENGVRWFNFYDAGTKKWTTMREDEKDKMDIRTYDRNRDAVTVAMQGKMVSLVLKESGPRQPLTEAVTPVALASNQVTDATGAPAIAIAGPAGANPNEKMERLAEEIVRRREERRRRDAPGANSQT